MIPLTHHEILERIAPVAGRGRHVDLAATDRAARRIAFRAVEHAADAAAGRPALTETLRLEDADRGALRLTRTLGGVDCPEASLVVEGADLAAMLDEVEAVPPARQVVSHGGVVIAMSHRLDGVRAGPPVARLLLTGAATRIAGLALTMEVPRMRGISADLELRGAAPRATVALPEDLFAVLGWPWGRLQRLGDRWRGAVRLRGSGLRLGRDAEAKFARTAVHLAVTLAEPPVRFHERWVAARWRVAARRAVPLLASLAMIAGAAFASRLDLEQNSVLRMVIFQAPPLLLALVFCMREIPRVEVPPMPRRPTAASWSAAA